MRRNYETQQPWAQPAAWPKGAELESSTPARPASLAADVAVPILQAAITGGLVSGLLTFVVWELVPDLDGEPVKVWAVGALAIASIAWVLLLTDTRRLLWSVERLVGMDLDQDGTKGAPVERLIMLNAPKAREEAERAENAAKMSQFAEFVARLPHRGTDTRTWEPVLGRPTYQEYRDALIKLGWAKWNSTKRDGTPNERRGWTLVLPASEILRRISG